MPEPDFLTATRTAYDAVAVDYAELLRDQLAGNPFDRAMLATFAELIRADDRGRVADVGCGPGRITAHLHSLGVDAFGIDLSPAMVGVARRRHPELDFDEGSILSLDLADGALAGAVAWYSIIHIPPDQRPTALAELGRVLRPGGRLLLAFQVGDEAVHLTEGYGHDISLDAYRLDPDEITTLLRENQFVLDARLVREPKPPERTPQAYLLARKAAD